MTQIKGGMLRRRGVLAQRTASPAVLLILLLTVGAIGVRMNALTTRASATAPPYFTPASSATVSELQLPFQPTNNDPTAASPDGVVTGPDGNVWVAEYAASKVARITPAGSITEFPTTYAPFSIIVGPDGNLWVNEPNPASSCCYFGRGKIAQITTGGVVTEFDSPSGMGSPFTIVPAGITSGPDGNVWFTEADGRSVARITPGGVITEFHIPDVISPTNLIDGPDGRIWVLVYNTFHRLDLTTGTWVGDYLLDPLAQPTALTHGPDGNIWMTERTICGGAGVGSDYVSKVTAAGVYTRYPVQRDATCPAGITTGPDGNLWFTEYGANMVGRITTSGVLTHVRVPNAAQSGLSGITTGPDGRLWFGEAYLGRVGRLDPTTVTPPPAPCMVVTADTSLKSDVGPCLGDGILVTRSNLTLNLNGHKVFGGGGRYGDFAGVHLLGTSNVTVVGGKSGGQITGFDAGVLMDGGSANTVLNLSIHDNFSGDIGAIMGDGILILHSASNIVKGNVLTANGQFDNVGILGVDSNNNVLRKNELAHSTGFGVQVSPFFELSNPRRGETITGNNILSNYVHDNLVGINDLANTYSTVAGNTVQHNGFFPDGSRYNSGNGIGVQGLFTTTKDLYVTVDSNTVEDNGAFGIDLVASHNVATNNTSLRNREGVILEGSNLSNQAIGNVVSGNADIGIFINRGTQDLVQNNTVTANTYGIFVRFGQQNQALSNTATGNSSVDLLDVPDCGTNVWSGNVWSGTISPPCVGAGGHQVTAGTNSAASVSAASISASATTPDGDAPAPLTRETVRQLYAH